MVAVEVADQENEIGQEKSVSSDALSFNISLVTKQPCNL